MIFPGSALSVKIRFDPNVSNVSKLKILLPEIENKLAKKAAASVKC